MRRIPIRAPLRRVRVTGDSMRPTLEPGDRVVCVAPWRIRVGHLVAVHDPRDETRLLVKRVVTIDDDTDTVTVEGDNAAASTDSRAFGALPRELVVGRAVWRYFPESRRGRLRG